ncbi:MAG TPA: SMC-Scp complex subunit ScpB [Acidimicrobiales bacterium]|nr:SMC-Scp complex subunit ScpB [Acidimicrobiales bacterium]
MTVSTETRRAFEALLMVAEEPISGSLCAQLLEISQAVVDELAEALMAEYEAADRGFVLRRVAGGYRLYSHPDMAAYVERFVLEGQTARLSNAALETLAIVAYKQPISRGQVAEIRGVNVDSTLRTLVIRGYVAEVGRDPGPGQALMYGTTPMFLEKLGLNDLSELPPLADFVPGPEVMAGLESSLLASPAEPAPDAEAAAASSEA